MASNTKLFPEQKQYVKQWCKDNDTAEFFDNEKITILAKPDFKGSRMFVVSISTMAPNEKKFRSSVGRYYAISNMENGQYVLMDYNTMWSFLEANDCVC